MKYIAVMNGWWNLQNHIQRMEELWNYDDNPLIFIAKVLKMQIEFYLLLNREMLVNSCVFFLFIVHVLGSKSRLLLVYSS